MSSAVVYQGSVPDLYKCNYSNQLMVDPIVVVETGEVYDKASLKYLDQDMLRNFELIPLHNLRKAIYKFQSATSNNQPEEVLQQDEGETQMNLSDDLNTITKEYQQKMMDIRSYNDEVQEAFDEVGGKKEVTKITIQKYQTEISQFCEIGREFEEMDLDGDAEVIWKIRQKLVSATKSLFSIVDDCNQLMLQLFQKKNRFENLLSVLQSKEEYLIQLREKLQKVLKSLNVETSFVEEYNTLSNFYIKPKQISENELRDLLANNQASNISLHLESTEDYKKIQIEGQIRIKRLHVTSARKGTKYLQFVLKNEHSSIKLLDCKFVGVGLSVNGFKKNNHVTIKNIEVFDSPASSIYIRQCEYCHINKGVGKNMGIGLEIYDVNNSMIENFTSQDSATNLFHFTNTDVQLKNCVAKNAKGTGIYVYSGSATGQNITFEGNYKNTYGNYIGK